MIGTVENPNPRSRYDAKGTDQRTAWYRSPGHRSQRAILRASPPGRQQFGQHNRVLHGGPARPPEAGQRGEPLPRAAARDILEGCMDQQRWFTAHTDHDPQYDEPMTMWRDAVDELCSGAADVERGIDRGDQPLVRTGRRAVAAAR